MSYTVFIDESGDAGIKKVQTVSSGGASPYLVFGAIAAPTSRLPELREALKEISTKVGKQRILHCSRLSHEQKVYACTELEKLEYITLFGLISKKSTLENYSQTIKQESWKFYNKCAHYLLERIGKFAASKGIDPSAIDIVFEKGNFNYGPLKSYIKIIQRKPLNPNAALLKNIDANYIVPKTKDDEDLLQFADLVAHAIYKCVSKSASNFHIVEPRYFQILKPRVFSCPRTGSITDFGLKPIHKLEDLGLDKIALEAFGN